MKTIKERAENYACQRHVLMNSTNRAACYGYIAGAYSEREELLRWHDPKELPNHTKQVLLKLENEDGCVRYTVRRFMFGRVWGRLLPMGYSVCGWRPIHENE